MDKLDYLAQQEEALRKLNEQLDAKKSDLLKNADEVANKQAEPADLFANAAWTVNEPPKEEEAVEEEDHQQIAEKSEPRSKLAAAAEEEDDEDLSQVQNY